MPEMPLIKFLDGYETIAEMEPPLAFRPATWLPRWSAANANAAAGEDPDFHKQPDYLAAQDHGPWAVFDLSLAGRCTRVHHGRSGGVDRR